MAAQTPSAAGSSAVVGDPLRTIPIQDSDGQAPTRMGPKEGYRHRCFYFADVDAADAWASGLQGVVCTAWTSESSGSVLTNRATAATGAITLAGSAANQTGWLHVWTAS